MKRRAHAEGGAQEARGAKAQAKPARGRRRSERAAGRVRLRRAAAGRRADPARRCSAGAAVRSEPESPDRRRRRAERVNAAACRYTCTGKNAQTRDAPRPCNVRRQHAAPSARRGRRAGALLGRRLGGSWRTRDIRHARLPRHRQRVGAAQPGAPLRHERHYRALRAQGRPGAWTALLFTCLACCARCTPARRARGTAAPPGAPCVRRRRRSRRCHAQSRPLTPLSRHGATPSSPGGHDWRRAGDNGGRDRQAEREESAAHRHGRHRRLCWCAACRNGAQTYPAAVSLALLRAGATADAFTLFERLETKLEEHPARAPAALCAHAARRADRSVATRAPPRLDRRGSSRARAWSWPRRGAWTSSCAAWTCVYSASLRCFSPTRAHACCSAVPSARAQAVMVVADETHSLQITGTGDVLEPHDGIIGAQSASPAAQTPSYCNCCADAPSPATSHRLGRAVRAGGRARAHRHPGNGCHDNRWVSPDVLAAFSVSCADAARVQPSAP